MPAARPFLKDTHFWWAALAALPVWGLGLLWLAPSPAPAWPLEQPREFLFLCLLYPIAEELVFRGLLQGTLRKRAGLRRAVIGISGANVLTSLIFTALHFLLHPPLAAALVLVPSLVFGYFRDRHGNLQAAIALHVFYNLGYFWLFASAA